MDKLLKQVSCVLVETSHPGNIGSAARSLKTMGLADLRLVNPVDFPSPVADSMSSGADDLLRQAKVHGSLDDALADANVVVGASARLRTIEWPMLHPRECASLLADTARQGGRAAMVFGRERTGLSNEELDRCKYLVHIPANPEYSSLNVASSVQILAYELYQAVLEGADALPKSAVRMPVEHASQAGFNAHLEQMLQDIGFFDKRASVKLMRRLVRLFQRAELDEDEVNILRGVFSTIQGRKSMRRD